MKTRLKEMAIARSSTDIIPSSELSLYDYFKFVSKEYKFRKQAIPFVSGQLEYDNEYNPKVYIVKNAVVIKDYIFDRTGVVEKFKIANKRIENIKKNINEYNITEVIANGMIVDKLTSILNGLNRDVDQFNNDVETVLNEINKENEKNGLEDINDSSFKNVYPAVWTGESFDWDELNELDYFSAEDVYPRSVCEFAKSSINKELLNSGMNDVYTHVIKSTGMLELCSRGFLFRHGITDDDDFVLSWLSSLPQRYVFGNGETTEDEHGTVVEYRKTIVLSKDPKINLMLYAKKTTFSVYIVLEIYSE